MTLPPAAQTAIEEEEQVVATVMDSLEAQLHHAQHRLTNERSRARVLTSQLVAAPNDEDRALLASDEAVSHELSKRKAKDTKALEKLIKKPYFARFVVQEQQGQESKHLEYKLGFSANPDCRIVDWRKAPISKLYYEYREGDEYSEEIQGRERTGQIVLRNGVVIEQGELQELSCKHGNFVRRATGWEAQGDSNRIRASYGELPNILALITPDQFRTITTEAETALLIQGIAGSGKTTVALHRLAWLLHEDNSPIAPEECVVIVLSRILQSYVTTTLPSMGINDINVLTFHQWATKTITTVLPHLAGPAGQLRRPSERPPASVERVLASLALLQLLEQREQQHTERLVKFLTTTLPWEQLPNGILTVFTNAQKRHHLPVPLLRELQEALDKAGKALRSDHPRAQGLLQAADLVGQEYEKLQNPESDLLSLLNDTEALLACDDSGLLDRSVLETAAARVAANQAVQAIDGCADAILLRLIELRRGGVLLPSGKFGHYQHIVCDEVQDLSAVELATLVGAVPATNRLTLVGDTAQEIGGSRTFPGWEKLQTHWNFQDADSSFITLSVSFRSTLPIMRLAEYLQQRHKVTEGRPGRVPIWFRCTTESYGVRAALDWLMKAVERYPNALTAVICRDDAEAKHVASLLKPTFGSLVRIGNEQSFSFAEGIVVTSVACVKGLEFCNAVIWNPSNRNYDRSTLSRNLLYVAITRAEENLCIVTWGRPTSLLPPSNSRLMRVIRLGVEEE